MVNFWIEKLCETKWRTAWKTFLMRIFRALWRPESRAKLEMSRGLGQTMPTTYQSTNQSINRHNQVWSFIFFPLLYAARTLVIIAKDRCVFLQYLRVKIVQLYIVITSLCKADEDFVVGLETKGTQKTWQQSFKIRVANMYRTVCTRGGEKQTEKLSN